MLLPHNIRNKRGSLQQLASQQQHNAELQRVGIIAQADQVEYAVNIVVAPKKDADGNWTATRVCQDYRAPNDAHESDNYRLHLPEELWDKVAGSTLFTKIDLRSGFFQLPMDPESAKMTGFWWGNRCFFYKRVPFGLKNAPAHFQRVMDHELGRMHHAAV